MGEHMAPKLFYLNENQGKSLIRAANDDIFEVPISLWEQFQPFRIEDTIAVMGSANFHDGKVLNGIQAVAGYDQLVVERNPKPGELLGNAYHWVLQQTTNNQYPYLLHGPYTKETRVPHHFDAPDIDEYP